MPPTLQILGVSAATSALLFLNAPGYTIAGSYFWTEAVLFSFVFTAWLFWSIAVYPRFFSPLRDLPSPPGRTLFMGHVPDLVKNPTGIPMRKWVKEVPNNGLIRYQAWFNTERLLLTNPKTLGEVLVTKNYEFIKPAHLRKALGRILGVGILLAEGDEHKKQRKDLMPAFAFRHIKDLYPIFWGKSREMVNTISETINKPDPATEKVSNVVEVSEWTSRATLDIIGAAGMGRDFNSLQIPENPLSAVYKTVFNPSKNVRYLQLAGQVLPQWFIQRLPVKRNQQLMEANLTIKQTCRDLIAEKRAKMEKGQTMSVDILSVALQSGGFTDEELVNQMMTFLVAGHETTSTSMTWAIYLLCKHKDVQSRLRAEVCSKLPSARDQNSSVSASDIDNCHYLHAVCNEVLRLWSPVALTFRVAAQDSTINGHFVPKGTMIVICPYAINVSQDLWGDDADEFNPDRWMREGQANKGGAESNYSFLTFLHGPRSCIGQSFAKAEFACLLAAWVGRFEFEFEKEDYELQIGGGVTQKPKGGLNVRLTENQDW